MLLATYKGDRVEPWPAGVAYCPGCRSEVVAKCGSVNQWHWSHRSKVDCDQWSERETPWHAWWKSRAPENCREVVIGPHRADIQLLSGRVVEIQHSPLSSEEISEREAFYGDMVWVVDGRAMFDRFDWRPRDGYHSFRWKTPKRSWFSAQRPIWIDFGPEVFEVKKIHAQTPCGGWGYLRSKSDALSRLGLLPLSAEECCDILAVDIWSADFACSLSFRAHSIDEANSWLSKNCNGVRVTAKVTYGDGTVEHH